MTLHFVPTAEDAFDFETPNGFRDAMFVDTPLCEIVKSHHTDRGTIYYEHDGFVGEAPFTEEEARMMAVMLRDYVKTDEYLNHPYFSSRQNQMEGFQAFVEQSGGFVIN